MSAECIFCKILNKELPATVVEESDDIIVIEDIAPKAPLHYLVIPKKHIYNVSKLEEEDAHLMGKMMLMAKKIAQKLPDPKAFGLIINNGAEAGQSVFHLHAHLVSGKKMTDL